MKILFVCRANVGRSQMAEALFNKMSKKHMAESAGTKVDTTWETLIDFAKINPSAENVIIVMREEGLEVGHKTRKQINEEMLKDYDKVIVLARPEECPEYLVNNSKTVFWDIEDAVGTDYDFHVLTRDRIKRLIVKFIKEI